MKINNPINVIKTNKTIAMTKDQARVKLSELKLDRGRARVAVFGAKTDEERRIAENKLSAIETAIDFVEQLRNEIKYVGVIEF